MTGAVAIVLAAGSGERVGHPDPKAFVELAGRPMLSLAVERAAACPSIDAIVVAVPAGLEGRGRAAAEVDKPVTVIAGAETRHASVRAALEAVPGDAAVIVCHDAARPFASAVLFSAVIGALGDADGAMPVLPVPDTVKRVRGGFVVGTVLRQELGLAQTPQAFIAAALREAHARALEADLEFTDDAAVLEWAGFRVRAVPGEQGNFKVTTLTDVARAELLAAEMVRG